MRFAGMTRIHCLIAVALLLAVSMAWIYTVRVPRLSERFDYGPQPVVNDGSVRYALLGEATVFRCGVVDKSKPTKYRVDLRNDSDKELHIRGTGVSCGCVKVLEAPGAIPAGGTGTIWFGLDPVSAGGHLKQHIIVFTDNDDHIRSTYRIEILASIRGASFKQAEVQLGTLMPGASVEKRLTVSSIGFCVSKLISVECDNSDVEAIISETKNVLFDVGNGQDAKQFEHMIDVRSLPTAKIGDIGGRIKATIETESGRLEVNASITARVSGRVVCTPARLAWANAERGEVVHGVVDLRWPESNPVDVSIIEVSTSIDGIVNEIVPMPDGKYQLRVQYKFPSDANSNVARATVTGRIGGEVLFEIPFLAVAKPPSNAANVPSGN